LIGRDYVEILDLLDVDDNWVGVCEMEICWNCGYFCLYWGIVYGC